MPFGPQVRHKIASFDLGNPECDERNRKLIFAVRRALQDHNLLSRPRVYLHKLSDERHMELARIVRERDGDVQDSPAGATHIVVPDPEVRAAPNCAAPLVFHPIPPTGPRFCVAQGGLEAEPGPDGLRPLRTLASVRGRARVHWKFFPDSYDTWIRAVPGLPKVRTRASPSRQAPPLTTPLTRAPLQPDPADRRRRPVWRVYARLIADLHAFNEWPNELDYEVPESDSTATAELHTALTTGEASGIRLRLRRVAGGYVPADHERQPPAQASSATPGAAEEGADPSRPAGAGKAPMRVPGAAMRPAEALAEEDDEALPRASPLPSASPSASPPPTAAAATPGPLRKGVGAAPEHGRSSAGPAATAQRREKDPYRRETLVRLHVYAGHTPATAAGCSIATAVHARPRRRGRGSEAAPCHPPTFLAERRRERLQAAWGRACRLAEGAPATEGDHREVPAPPLPAWFQWRGMSAREALMLGGTVDLAGAGLPTAQYTGPEAVRREAEEQNDEPARPGTLLGRGASSLAPRAYLCIRNFVVLASRADGGEAVASTPLLHATLRVASGDTSCCGAGPGALSRLLSCLTQLGLIAPCVDAAGSVQLPRARHIGAPPSHEEECFAPLPREGGEREGVDAALSAHQRLTRRRLAADSMLAGPEAWHPALRASLVHQDLPESLVAASESAAASEAQREDAIRRTGAAPSARRSRAAAAAAQASFAAVSRDELAGDGGAVGWGEQAPPRKQARWAQAQAPARTQPTSSHAAQPTAAAAGNGASRTSAEERDDTVPAPPREVDEVARRAGARGSAASAGESAEGGEPAPAPAHRASGEQTGGAARGSEGGEEQSAGKAPPAKLDVHVSARDCEEWLAPWFIAGGRAAVDWPIARAALAPEEASKAPDAVPTPASWASVTFMGGDWVVRPHRGWTEAEMAQLLDTFSKHSIAPAAWQRVASAVRSKLRHASSVARTLLRVPITAPFRARERLPPVPRAAVEETARRRADVERGGESPQALAEAAEAERAVILGALAFPALVELGNPLLALVALLSDHLGHDVAAAAAQGALRYLLSSPSQPNWMDAVGAATVAACLRAQLLADAEGALLRAAAADAAVLQLQRIRCKLRVGQLLEDVGTELAPLLQRYADLLPAALAWHRGNNH